MIIRELTHEELLMAVELNYRCCNDDSSGIIPYDSNVDREIKSASNWINDKNCDDIRHMYGAFDGDNFLGYAGGGLNGRSDTDLGVELNYLFVKKEHRGKALALKLIRTILVEFVEYGANKLIIRNWHDSKSNSFYRYLDGEVIKQVIETPNGKEVLVDVFSWDINNLIKQLNDKLHTRGVENGGFAFNQALSEGILITTTYNKEDIKIICKGLFQHNVRKTYGLLKKPGFSINIYLKESGRTTGAILCETFNLCMYIDVMWIDESSRGKGFGKSLILQAEKIAKDNGCIFSHTCTFSYQSPEFYKSCGYTVFGILDDYPNDIVQYFLKKKL